MAPIPHPTEHPWSTRGELLSARAAAVQEIERQFLSLRALAGQSVCGLLVVFAAGVASAALEESRVTGVHVAIAVVCSGLALLAAVFPVRRALRNRKLIAELLAWEAAERQGRELPPGHIPPDLRMPVDARDDPDFEQVAGAAGAAAYTRPWGSRLLLRSVPGGIGLVVGFALVVGGTFDFPSPVSVAFLLSGGYVLLSSVVMVSASTRLAYRMTRSSSALDADIRALRAQRMGAPAA
ncbi:hypothetical protein [Blastococcus sp. TBT05-19]|uniref:hypothetical protein n=1 Tax=Blastococcus sp. TBT05-19 TaxID=2250581 RepID=UPI0011BEC069|nr:hypothetical protein [Blastococcus sp. TBT05-19]